MPGYNQRDGIGGMESSGGGNGVCDPGLRKEVIRILRALQGVILRPPTFPSRLGLGLGAVSAVVI